MSSHIVRDWMSSPVVVVDPDTTVSYALTVMRRRGIHSVVVDLADHETPYGILTSTDIRDKIIAQDLNPVEVKVREIMSTPVQTASPDWSLKQCSIAMQQYNIHHLPVVDQHNELIGMISDTDLFCAAEEAGWEDEGLEERVGDRANEP